MIISIDKAESEHFKFFDPYGEESPVCEVCEQELSEKEIINMLSTCEACEERKHFEMQ